MVEFCRKWISYFQFYRKKIVSTAIKVEYSYIQTVFNSFQRDGEETICLFTDVFSVSEIRKSKRERKFNAKRVRLEAERAKEPVISLEEVF